jgi:creatinine amidohydrolase
MAILRYENLTHQDLSGLPREKTVVLLPAGPLEQHGPHLPLGTDALTAAYFAEQIARRLDSKRPDWNFILFPTIFAGSDTLTYTGTIEVKPHVLRALLYSNCKQLCKDGFRTQIVVGTHGGPRHMVVLEEVAAKIRWRFRARMVSASAKLLLQVVRGEFIERIAARLERDGAPLTEKEREGMRYDYHGGLLETSMMLAAYPALVKDSYKTLEPAIIDSYFKLTRRSGKNAGDGLGHLGSPALARAEIGRAAIEAFVEDTLPLLERMIDGEKVWKQFRSPFYFVPFFRTHFGLIVAFAAAGIAFAISISMMTHFITEMYK